MISRWVRLRRIAHKVSSLKATGPVLYDSVYRPEPPLGFVPRSDPNFYFLRRA